MATRTRRYQLLRSSFVLLLIGMLIAGCNTGSSTSSEGPAPFTGSASANVPQAPPSTASDRPVVTVDIQNFAFSPAEIVAPPGARIVFINHDPTPHNVVQGSAKEVTRADHKPLFSSPEIGEGETWELILDEPGDYAFACTVAGHYLMGMEGVIRIAQGAEAVVTTEAAPPAATARDHAAELATGHDHGAASSTPVNLPEGHRITPEGLVELEPFRVEGNVKEFAIDIQEVSHELLDGVVVTAWAFNGVVPGPTLRVQEGDIVRVHFTNTHHQPHTIHWHGIYADQKHDGVPHTSLAVMPGETYVYEFVAEHAGTYIYHCHVDSYRHIDMGMYGALIIDPVGEKSWDREYTLVLDDWDSHVEPLATRYEPVPNHFLINGKAFPELPTLPIKVGETTRVRLINIGNHNFAMHLHGPHFKVVATDGFPLPQPYMKDTLDIAPGERYEIEIRPTKAGMYPFHAHNIQYVRNDGSYPGGMHLMFDILDEDAKI